MPLLLQKYPNTTLKIPKSLNTTMQNTTVQKNKVLPHLLGSDPLQSLKRVKMGLGFSAKYCAYASSKGPPQSSNRLVKHKTHLPQYYVMHRLA